LVLACGRLRRVLVLAGLVFAVLPVGSALAQTTIGTTRNPSLTPSAGNLEEALNYAAMPRLGTVTSFQTQACSATGQTSGTYDFQVLRPLGSNQYLVVGDTGDQSSPCDGQLHSYPVAIAVQAGDVLGVYVVDFWRGALSVGGGSVNLQLPVLKPAVGNTVTLPKSVRLFARDESATFKAVLGRPPPIRTSKKQCKRGGWKNFGNTFKNQGQCVRLVNSHHKKHHHKHHPSGLTARVWES
jgi:hypothetical protein